MPMYAAYGTNMHPEQMCARAPHSPFAGTGWARGWRLTFAGEDLSWEGAMATVVPDPASRVFVVLYDVSPEDELSMDRWEGTDLIPARKVRIPVERGLVVPGGPPVSAQVTEFEVDAATGPAEPPGADSAVLAWAYVMDAFEGGLPSASYLGRVADAAEAAGAPPAYVLDLRTRAARSDGPGGRER